MKRNRIPPRSNWQERLEQVGFIYHSVGDLYWDESAAYQIDYKQVEILEKATLELNQMIIDAVDHVIAHNLFDRFHLPAHAIEFIKASWCDNIPSIYGRFDLAYDGINPPKLLEYNADTPTSLFESSIVQWYWLQDYNPNFDQFNSIHEKLVAYWQHLIEYMNRDILYFTCVKDNVEDFITTSYMRDCAIQAGIETTFIYTEDIGWDQHRKCFTDLEERPILNIFKLYPWEWMLHENFGPNLSQNSRKTIWIEPAWKVIASSKALLPILYDLFPNCPYLLKTSTNPAAFHGEAYVSKPIYSREGANVTIYGANGEVKAQTSGEYGEEGFIYQAFAPLPEFGQNYALVGSWLIGGEPAGIGIRESDSLITNNMSRFVPQFIRK